MGQSFLFVGEYIENKIWLGFVCGEQLHLPRIRPFGANDMKNIVDISLIGSELFFLIVHFTKY